MINLVVLMGRISRTPEVKKGKDSEFTVTGLAVPNGVDEKGERAAGGGTGGKELHPGILPGDHGRQCHGGALDP